MKKALRFFILFLFVASLTLTIGRLDSKIVEIPDTPKPDYLESYIDPAFGTKVTRITGDPGTAIPDVYGVWGNIARHHYSKDSAWNCDQSLIYLQRHKEGGSPRLLFLDGTTYTPLFGYRRGPGSDSRWHVDKPNIMIYVKENVIGYWDVRKNKTQIAAFFPGYSDIIKKNIRVFFLTL